LDTVVVIGTREEGYRATVATTANKSDTPAKQTPFSVQVVTHELIEDRGVTTFGEAVRTVPGLTSQVGFVGTNDRFRLRGFATPSNLKNGIRRSVFIPVDELANIEQIEVLKGPASALYGRFEPGGVVNLVTKKPLGERQTTLDFTAGDYSFLRSTFDSTGPISETLGYRVNAAWQDSDSFRDFVDLRTRFISPVFAWSPTEDTKLVLELEYLKRDQGLDRGFGSNPLFLRVPIDRSYGEPGMNGENTSRLASLTLDHALSDAWNLRVAGHAGDGELTGRYIGFGFPPISGASTANPVVNRVGTIVFDKETDYAGQAEIAGKLSTGNVTHRLLLGAEVGFQEEDSSFDSAQIGSISLYNPVYGQTFGTISPSTFASSNDAVAAYVQDELSFGSQWRVLLGGRYDRIEYSSKDSFSSGGARISADASAFSPRVGVTFTPVPAVSLYASWAESFSTDVFARLSSGELAEPIEGEQIEAGAKFELLDQRLRPTIALFEVTRSNGTVADPNDPTFSFSIQTGEQRGRGVEIDVPWMISPQWRVIASYTRLDAEFTEDPSRAGNRLANAPKHNGSLWSTYDFVGFLQGLSIGTGIHHVGEREATDGNTFQLPSYTRWDANLTYRFGSDQQWRLQINAQNLTDKRYYDSGGSFVPMYPGAPRTVTGTLGVRF
jgi:iron complex outermembrane receptor protein